MWNLEFSHYEDAPYHPPVIWEITKGEQVGGDTPQKHNQDLKLDQDWEESKIEQPFVALSIDEMQKYINSWKNELERVVWMNPDWPPAKWNPEAENRLAWDLEKWFNHFI